MTPERRARGPETRRWLTLEGSMRGDCSVSFSSSLLRYFGTHRSGYTSGDVEFCAFAGSVGCLI